MLRNCLFSLLLMVSYISLAQVVDKKEGLRKIGGGGDGNSSLEGLTSLSTLAGLESLSALSSLSSLEALQSLEALEQLESLESLEVLSSLGKSFDYSVDYGVIYQELYSDGNQMLHLQDLDLDIQRIIKESLKSVEQTIESNKKD